MSNVIIIGGHGKVALILARLLSSGGNSVTSVFRNPDHSSDVAGTGATPEVADVENLTSGELADLIRGHDAVVWSAGAGGGNPARTYAVDREAAIRAMDGAEAAGVKRFVMVSYMGAGQNHGVPEDNDFYPYAQAKADADDHLRASGLDWTILGPGRLTQEQGSGRVHILGEVDKRPASADTSRENVALMTVAVLKDDSTVRKMLEFTDGQDLIADALAALR